MKIINRKYTEEIIKNKLYNYGYYLSSKFESINKKVHIHDNDGYYYLCNLQDLFGKNKRPFIIAKNNPYTIQNIKNYLKLNSINLELLSDTYINNSTLLKWKCSCGKVFKKSWQAIQQGCMLCDECTSIKNKKETMLNKFNEVDSYCMSLNFKLLFIERDKNDCIVSLHLKDSDGYKYVTSYANLKKNHMPFKFHKHNIYTIYNINRWLNKIGLSNYVCIDTEYINNQSKLKFIHLSCNKIFYLSLGKLQRKINENGICVCPYCFKKKNESYHASILKQIFLHNYNSTVVEDRSCINFKTGRALPTDIVCYETKQVIEIQSEYHDQDYKKEIDKYKKNFWESKGFDVFTPDIRDYTIIELIQLFFPDIKTIPDYVDLKYNSKPDINYLQELLNSGLSTKEVSLESGIGVDSIRSYVFKKLLYLPNDYKRNILNQKEIVQLDKNGVLLNTFKTISEADRAGSKAGTIRRVLYKKQKYSYNCIWKFKDDYINEIQQKIAI